MGNIFATHMTKDQYSSMCKEFLQIKEKNQTKIQIEELTKDTDNSQETNVKCQTTFFCFIFEQPFLR